VERKRTSRFSWLSYLLYALLLTAILLYVRFPAEKMRSYLNKRITSAIPGIVMEPGEFNYGFPVKLTLDTLKISRENGGDEIALLENTSVSPVLTGLGLEYVLEGTVYGGTFQANVKLAPLAGQMTLDTIELTKVALDKSALLVKGLQRDLSGTMDFDGSCVVSYKGQKDATLTGNVTVHNGSFLLRQPILSLQKMALDQLQFAVSYTAGVLKVADGMLQGPEMNVDFAGDVQATGRFEAWTLGLKGDLAPQQGFAEKNPRVLRVLKRLQQQFKQDDLPFRLDGDIGNPRFRFGND